MLEVTALIPADLAKLNKHPTEHALDLRTYKRNRSVIIRKEGEESFYFVENGFYQGPGHPAEHLACCTHKRTYLMQVGNLPLSQSTVKRLTG